MRVMLSGSYALTPRHPGRPHRVGTVSDPNHTGHMTTANGTTCGMCGVRVDNIGIHKKWHQAENNFRADVETKLIWIINHLNSR